MPIDVGKVLGAELPLLETSWNEESVILYHVGIGAGSPPTDPNELEYTYEANLKVLPSFATVPPFPMVFHLGAVEGLELNLAMLLHGEQEVTVHRPIPTAAAVSHRGRIAEIWDKGSGALMVLEVETQTADGEALFTNRYSNFLRGEGGFGGEPGPKAGHEPPGRSPDHKVEVATSDRQALLYRLSGDKNPLHVDPAFAALGGFDRPILQGLCSFGIVCKAAVDTVHGGRVEEISGYRARFAGPVIPGETVVVSMWEDEGAVILAAETAERGSAVITNAVLRSKQ